MQTGECHTTDATYLFGRTVKEKEQEKLEQYHELKREREREIGRFCQCKKVVVIPMKKTDGEILQPHVEWFVLKPD